MQTETDLIMMLNGRAAVYEYFTLCFHNPSADNFLGITKKFAAHFKRIAADSNISAFMKNADELILYAEKITDELDALDEINRAYTSLFLIGDQGIAIEESVYLSPSGLVKQEPWEDLLRVYSRHGFGIPESMGISEEHLSAELLFMAFMAKKISERIENSDDKGVSYLAGEQLDFLKKHIMRWVPALYKDITSSSYTHVDIFKTLASILYSFLLYDINLLSDFIQEYAE